MRGINVLKIINELPVVEDTIGTVSAEQSARELPVVEKANGIVPAEDSAVVEPDNAAVDPEVPNVTQ